MSLHMHLSRTCTLGLWVASALLLSGCVLRVAPNIQALPDYLRSSGGVVGTALSAGALNAQLTYLHVTLGTESPALMVLGYIDTPTPGQPALLTWYSATGQSLQTQQGRVVGLSGLQGAPVQVQYHPSPIPWPAVQAQGKAQVPVQLQRQWDVPTQYRYSLQESRTLHSAAVQDLPRAIQRHLAKHLLPYAPVASGNSPHHPQHWDWFVERGPSGPTSWYATATVQGTQQVVYSYQCIGLSHCLHLAPWPLAGVVLP
jgi:hypothetical protein